MVDLTTPAGATARTGDATSPTTASDGATHVTLAEPDAVWVLRLAETTAREMGEAAGFDLTAEINAATGLAAGEVRTDPRLALRLGPDEWWLRTGRGFAADAAARLGTALGNRTHALVDVSDRHVTFEINGPGSEALLATGTAVDLHVTAFPAGRCTRTVFARAEVVLARGPGDERFTLTVNRSFASYVETLLRDALPMIWVRRPLGERPER